MKIQNPTTAENYKLAVEIILIRQIPEKYGKKVPKYCLSSNVLLEAHSRSYKLLFKKVQKKSSTYIFLFLGHCEAARRCEVVIYKIGQYDSQKNLSYIPIYIFFLRKKLISGHNWCSSFDLFFHQFVFVKSFIFLPARKSHTGYVISIFLVLLKNSLFLVMVHTYLPDGNNIKLDF